MLRRGPKSKAELTHDVYTDNHDHITDHAFHQSEDGHLVQDEAINVRPRKRRVVSGDQFASWTPFHSRPDVAKVLSTTPEENNNSSDEDESDDEVGDPGSNGKRKKRYASSDDPNGVWRENAIELLHKLYRFDGLGDALASPGCCSCSLRPSLNTDDKSPSNPALFRCFDCHLDLECTECCLKRHAGLPLHQIKQWNGSFFESVTLQNLGLVFQLGHGGASCIFPDTTPRQMTVLDVNGIHSVSFQYCNCHSAQRPSNVQQLMRTGWYPATTTDPRSCATFKVLDLYRLLNVKANVNANDFVNSLVTQTNATKTAKLPDGYRPFARMARQWAFLHRVKRSGVGLLLQHINDIKPGSLAVICWACPNPDLNLRKDWEQRKDKDSYLYMPVLAVDANFRLKNRLRKGKRVNEPLSPGSAYFVDPEAYKDFLKDYVSEKDISTCIAFAALLEKDTKLTTGLRTSGVAGCACARHELIRPQGLGDLQKGERYANVDFVFFSAVKGYLLPRLAVPYDIICQWYPHLLERMTRLPKELHLNPTKTKLTFGLPTWHAVAHELSCRTANSLSYQEGVGRTDGEGIERIWSLLNPASYATKEMGEGTRHDTLDDRIDSLNFTKNLGLGSTLARRLCIGITERDRQIENFNLYDKGLKDETRAEWKAKIEEWQKDSTKPNPYLPVNPGNMMTEAEVLASLAAADTNEAQQASADIRGTSMSSFLIAGFQLEDIQLKLRRDIRSISRGTSYQQVKIDLRRRAFFDKLEGFRDLQRIHMPGLKHIFQRNDSSSLHRTDSDAAENVQLWFPSDLSADDRGASCVPEAIELEFQFREARCNDALISLRHYLHAKQDLLAFRNANVVGQNDSTRARGVIDSVGDRVEAEAEKYRQSRTALLSLYGATQHEDYPPLTNEDITLDVITDPDLLAQAKLANAGSSSHRRNHTSMGKTTVSWVWTGLGGPTEVELQGPVGESTSVEWSKALARKKRWTEEVARLREEMRMVLRSLNTLASRWDAQALSLQGGDPRHPQTAIVAGARAYAAYQASIFRGIEAKFREEWNF